MPLFSNIVFSTPLEIREGVVKTMGFPDGSEVKASASLISKGVLNTIFEKRGMVSLIFL